MDKALAGSAFLTGDTFTVADAYLFVVANWAIRLKLDLSAFPHRLASHQWVAARPVVLAAMKAEGLLKWRLPSPRCRAIPVPSAALPRGKADPDSVALPSCPNVTLRAWIIPNRQGQTSPGTPARSSALQPHC